MKPILLLTAVVLFFSSCKSSQYTLQQSSNLRFSDYEQSFAMLSNENLSLKERLAFNALKKQLIQKKWIYDDVNPDVLVSATLLEKGASFYTYSALPESGQLESRKVKSYGSTFMVQFLHPVSYKCIWRGMAMDLPSDLNAFQFDRIALSMMEQ